MGLKITKEDVEYANNKLHEMLKENKKDRHVVIRNCLSDLDLSQADINYINSLVDKRLKKKNKEEKKREKLRIYSVDGRWEKHNAVHGTYNIYRCIATWIRNGSQGQPNYNGSEISLEEYEDFILDGDILYVKRKSK